MELFTELEFNQKKKKELLKGRCDICNSEYYTTKQNFRDARKFKYQHCCSFKCRSQSVSKKNPKYNEAVELNCTNCNNPMIKRYSQHKRTSHHFCSLSCSAQWNNTHKKHGTRRSKLESWIETELTKLYPDLEVHFNRKDTINSELDIYFPSLSLAFELNGIFHYEPIFGKDKLNQIENNDQRKMQACLEQGIELCIIDTSGLKYFKERNAEKYLTIITNLVNSKIELSKIDRVEVS